MDNENFSVGLTTPENLAKLDPVKIAAYNRLMGSIHALDPQRIVEINHNYSLYDAVKKGTFDRANFEVFNIHPYGSLKKVIDGEVAALGFKGEVPILVGEVFAHEKPVDPAREPRETRAEQVRIAASFAAQIRDAAAAKHVSGVILCAESHSGWFGWEDANTCRFGPWHAFAPERKDGKVVGIRHFDVKVPWPSLSGPGTKVQYLNGWAYLGGNFGLGLNWFDPTVPMFRTTMIDRSIRNAFDSIGGALPGLPATRVPEIVACMPKKDAGSFVYLSDVRRPGVREGVVADPEGTAWFRLPAEGRYSLSGVSGKRDVEIAVCPALSDKPGYEHLTWVDLGGGDPHVRQSELSREPEKEVRDVLMAGELLANGGFDYCNANGTPYGWSSCGPEAVATEGGCRVLRLRSGQSASQVITLEKSQTYRLTGSVTRRKGSGVASLTFSNWGCQKIRSFVCEAQGPDTQRFSFPYVSNGTERYLCVSVGGADSELIFDDLSLRAEEQPTDAAEDFSPGPFPLSEQGVIRNFLVLGPFPNRGDEQRGYEAATNDFLMAVGGEAHAPALYRNTVSVTYPDGNYWTPGDYTLHWKPIAFDDDSGNLKGITLPAAGITRKPSDSIAAYLACTLVSPEAQDAVLGLGSDDGYVVYVNGRRIGSSLTTRGAMPDQEKYPIRLAAGENRLLVKAIQEGGEWQIIPRLTDRDGKTLRDVKVLLPGEPSLISNGRFEIIREGRIADWNTSGTSVRTDGYAALRLSGNIAQATRIISLKGGHKYRVEGRVRAEACDAHGAIGVRTLGYDWLCKAEGRGAHARRWEPLSETFTAPFGISQAYFYCMNWYVGDRSVQYTDIKMFDLGESEQPIVISKEPGREPRFDETGRAVVWKAGDGTGWRRFDLASGSCTTLSESPSDVRLPEIAGLPDGTVRVSPDGRVAAVQTHVKGTVNLRFVELKSNKTIFETASVSGKMQITGCHSPAFVPGTSRVVYVSGDIQPVADLVMTDLSNGRTVKLTTDGADNQSPDVSPDGRRVAFVSYADGEYRVVVKKLP